MRTTLVTMAAKSIVALGLAKNSSKSLSIMPSHLPFDDEVRCGLSNYINFMKSGIN